MSYIDRLKTLNSEKCAPSLLQKVQKGGEGQSEGAFYSFCSTQGAHFQKIEPSNDANDETTGGDTPRRRWLITLPDGDVLDVTCTPPVTREELLRWHPEALSLEPYEATPAHPEAPMSASQEARIRAWLDSIGEEDAATIEEVLENCRTDAEARDYFLTRATEEQP